MRARLPLAIIFATLGACAGAAFSKGGMLLAVVFGLTVGFAAFLIPDNDRSVKLVAGRVASCALGGGLILAALTLGFHLSESLAIGAGVAVIVTPIAVAITQVQRWAAPDREDAALGEFRRTAPVRENSALGGFRRAALATAFLGVVALCPWELFLRWPSGGPSGGPSGDASQRLAIMLVAAVAAPALMIALHAAIVTKAVHTLDTLFEHAPSASRQHARKAALVFDLGVGTAWRVKTSAAHPYRRLAPATISCRGDGTRASSMLQRLSVGAATVATIAVVHAAALLLG